MLFCWYTTRRRMVGVGYGWLLRGTNVLMALGAFAVGARYGFQWVRELGSLLTAVAAAVALGVSIARKRAGVSGQLAEYDRRTERVAAMTGIERAGAGSGTAATHGPEFPPILDLIPALFGAVGLLGASIDAGGNTAVAILRTFVGAMFLGAVTDAMLLGHWYLVQPGLPRKLLNELVSTLGWIWPFEVVSLLLPTGMFSVFSGSIDDGWGGMLGWFWAACAVGTIALVVVTKAALKERAYAAVMAATGLLYLAILTAFGTDLVARAVLAA